MKMIMKSVAIAGVTALAITTMLAKGGRGGPQPVHSIRFTFRVALTNTDNDPSSPHAAGSASASESMNVESGADRESLSVAVKGLQPNSPYSLFATTDDGTNSFDAADFTTDKRGDKKLTLSTTVGRRGGIALGNLDPLTGVTELDIVEDSSNAPVTVLSADTTSPQSFTYIDKESETSTNGADGTLAVSASNRGARLALTASGLTPGGTEVLALNDASATNDTFTANSKGDLRISIPISANVLDLNSVSLTDTTTGDVLLFPLP